MTTSLGRRTASPNLLSRLIDAPDLVEIVRELPGASFAELIREVGVEDAGELLALATTEQLVAALDEDLFVSRRPGEREVFDQRRFVTWLEVLLEAGDDAVSRRFSELSEDFVAHALSQLIYVFDHELLRATLSQDHPAAATADKLLESALLEEIEGYVLVGRTESGWDAVLALVLALDRDNRAFLVRILDRCADLAADMLEDIDDLVEALSAAESLAEDVEASREDRRSRLGFVEPRAARGFLTLATRQLDGNLASIDRDSLTRSYFRDLERSGSGATPNRHVPIGANAASTESRHRVRALLPTPAQPAIADAAEPLGLALQELCERSPEIFRARVEELTYLANVLIAGAAKRDRRRFEPAEAARAALATVALGAEIEARERAWRPEPGDQPSTAELLAAVRSSSADLLFRKACSTLALLALPSHPAAIVCSRQELDEIVQALYGGPASLE